jgi:hypothetical protein
MKRLSMARKRHAPRFIEATKKPESADRVRAQCRAANGLRLRVRVTVRLGL